MSEPTDFPADTILGHVRLDIYASQKSGDINIFHEGAFGDPLVGFEYYPARRELVFVFEGDMAMPLGAELDEGLIPYFIKGKEVGVFQVTDDMKAGEGNIIPLRVVEG